MKGFIRTTLTVAIAWSLVACNPSGPKSSTAADVHASYVITTTTPYYKNSPAQAMPADGSFKAGTRVSVVKKMGNYTLVRAIDGTQGYVPTADIAPVAK
jgi:hypothetical protein